jgi:UDP-N-acetylglucosamine 1-carboxyvinyltransferase
LTRLACLNNYNYNLRSYVTVKLYVNGGANLQGTVRIQGAKNAGQKILPAIAALAAEVTIKNCSLVDDNKVLLEILEYLGAKVSINGETVVIDARPIESRTIPRELTRKSTGTFVFAGSMLRRFGYVRIGGPGGDRLGSRPVDFHLAAFEAFGGSWRRDGEYYDISAPRLTASEYHFPHKTANGTVNAVIAAAGAAGESRLTNPDRDPDIENFIDLMQVAGTEIDFDADGSLVVRGASDLHTQKPISITMVPDRNDAATWLVAAAVMGQRLTLTGMPPLGQFEALTDLMLKVGVELAASEGEVCVSRFDIDKARSSRFDVRSEPFPGMSTDWGPLVQVLLSQANGDFTFTETVFSQRFTHVADLTKMGAAIEYLTTNLYPEYYRFSVEDGRPHSISISGPRQLRGKKVCATDIRAGAALLIAALSAQGQTEIDCAQHLRRGYENLPERLRNVGADVTDYLPEDNHGHTKLL